MKPADTDLTRLEHQIERFLRFGVIAVAVLLAAGLVLSFAGRPVAGHWSLNAGIVVLMGIPATRVIASFIDALRRADRLLAWSTGIVMTILCWQLVRALV